METRITPSDNMRHELEDARAVMAAVVEVSAGKMRPLLNILGDIYVTSEAQKYYRDHPQAAIASAMVVNSFLQRLIGNIFLKYSTLPIPTKLFENEEKANQWLQSFFEEP